VLIGPVFPGPFFSNIQKLIVTTAMKHDYAITMGNNMWFPSALDTSAVDNHGVLAALGLLVHESVHLLDYARLGIEAFLTSYIKKAVVAGFSHDDIPDERRADRFQSAALGLLGRYPELSRLISTCDNDAILADLQSRRDEYRRAVNEAMPAAQEQAEIFAAPSTEAHTAREVDPPDEFPPTAGPSPEQGKDGGISTTVEWLPVQAAGEGDHEQGPKTVSDEDHVARFELNELHGLTSEPPQNRTFEDSEAAVNPEREACRAKAEGAFEELETEDLTPLDLDLGASVYGTRGDTTELGDADRSLLGDDQAGAGLAGATELSTRLTRVLPGAANGNGPTGLGEFDAPEHASAGISVQRMVDTWAMNGLIDGGAFIDTRKDLTTDRRDQPIVTWEIFTPLLTRTPTGKLVSYTDLAGGAHPNAHWYYIAPDPIGHPRPWNPGTLRQALLAGEAVALSIGQIILLAGDMYPSFEQLTGRDGSAGIPRPPVSLMRGVDDEEPWAYSIMSVKQNPAFPGTFDELGALHFLERVPSSYDRVRQEIRSRRTERFEQIRRIADFLRAARGPTKFSEAHLLARILEVSGPPTAQEIVRQAPWLKMLRADRPAGTVERAYVFNTLASNGHYLDLALKNRTHFSPLNWATFEGYHRRALEAIGRGMARPRRVNVRHPIPADAIALTAFGCHFLTDAFASGHMRTPVAQLGARGALASKMMHDLDNGYGLLVENSRGQRWRAFGDEYLHPGGAGGVRSRQTAVLKQLAARRLRGFDLSPDANRDRMMEAVCAAFKQLHYEAQRQGRVLSGSPFGLVLAENRGTSGNGLAGDCARGMPHDATTLTGRIDADIDAKIRYLKQHQPRPLPAGTNPADVLGNHPPLLVPGLDRQGNQIAVVPPKTPYRWSGRIFNMRRLLRLRWHGRTLEQDFSEYFHLEDQLRRHAPPWMPVMPDRVRSLVARELPEED
jgi:hypothetical protein